MGTDVFSQHTLSTTTLITFKEQVKNEHRPYQGRESKVYHMVANAQEM